MSDHDPLRKLAQSAYRAAKVVRVGESGPLEIHKPKRVHGWREFLAEIGIIVLGVLIALAAEQAVEALHWRHKVEQGREAIREEMAENAYFAEERATLAPCLEDRLAFLQMKLDAAGPKWEAEPWPRLKGHAFAEGAAYNVPIREWDTEVWRTLVADGTSAHFPRRELLRLSALYQYVEIARAENAAEMASIAPVAVLGRGFLLTDTSRASAQLALEDHRRMNRLAKLTGAQLRDSIKAAGMAARGAVWNQRMAGLRRHAADCAAGRPTPMTPAGYAIPES